MRIQNLGRQQRKLAEKVILKDSFGKIRGVGGFDLAFSGGRAFCSGIVLDWKTLGILEAKTLLGKEKFPYIPGFLAFREAPHIIKVQGKLSEKPDLLLIDGQGICHPRGIGIASHVGVLLDKPAIGIAKSRLCGECERPDGKGVGKIFLEGEHVGWILKGKGKPIFISPGHRVSVKSSLDIVSHCMKGGRLPEPLSLAHLYAERAKNNYENR